MPVIAVRSLPPGAAFDVAAAAAGVARCFSAGTGIAAERITVTWSLLEPGAYVVNGEGAVHQPRDSHPVLVDLLVPDFNDAERIEEMLRVLARAIARHAPVAEANVFINARTARSGRVFDAGEVVRW